MSGRVSAPIAPAAVAEFKPGPTDREFDRETRRLALDAAMKTFNILPVALEPLLATAEAIEAYLAGTATP